MDGAGGSSCSSSDLAMWLTADKALVEVWAMAAKASASWWAMADKDVSVLAAIKR